MSVSLQTEGPVIRHAALSTDPETAETERARLRREDAACTAGLRGAAAVVSKKPVIVEATRDLLDALRRARGFNSSFQRLHLAGGSSPTRPPPSDASVTELRRRFSLWLPGVLPADAEMRHSASPWRWALFDALATMTEDPDRAVVEWL